MPPRPTPADPYLTQAEAGEYLGLHARTIRRMVADGRLTAHRFGPNVVRLRKSEIDAAAQVFGGAA